MLDQLRISALWEMISAEKNNQIIKYYRLKAKSLSILAKPRERKGNKRLRKKNRLLKALCSFMNKENYNNLSSNASRMKTQELNITRINSSKIQISA